MFCAPGWPLLSKVLEDCRPHRCLTIRAVLELTGLLAQQPGRALVTEDELAEHREDDLDGAERLLRLDANGAFTVATARRVCHRLAEAGVLVAAGTDAGNHEQHQPWHDRSPLRRARRVQRAVQRFLSWRFSQFHRHCMSGTGIVLTEVNREKSCGSQMIISISSIIDA